VDSRVQAIYTFWNVYDFVRLTAVVMGLWMGRICIREDENGEAIGALVFVALYYLLRNK
jgi:hypothetical protein